MKIGILTQPLHSNFGGLLQAWALQLILTRKGHDAMIINRVENPKRIFHRVFSSIKKELYAVIGKRKRFLPITKELRDYSEQNITKFKHNKFTLLSQDIHSNDALITFLSTKQFDAYVVGSDQVWRPCYSPRLMTYFLDFVKDNKEVKKIAYAASFGTDKWELSPLQTAKALKLAPLFDLITVREESGVDLVKQYLHCEASQVVDPTMLLDKKDYIKLVETSTCPLHESEGDLFCYVLDSTDTVNNVIDCCASATNMIPFYCNYKTPIWKLSRGNSYEDSVVPPVEQWLKSFMDSKMVVTDSFHGVVFSIIFNKPFWVTPNVSRGTARFSSLLRQINLEDRRVSNPSDINWNSSIDWKKVNEIRKRLASNSLSLLFSHL